MIAYEVKKSRGYRYNLFFINTFGKFEFGVLLKKAAQTITKDFSRIIHKSNPELSPIGTDDGNERNLKLC